ncbi:alcohol dehydrogenase catalytic domain-containing protein, partial [Streptomyces goshikiensis]|uniref:alcohol dehydrogenase catalytic domain-containing protein n=1 Tax=Streptomyces goshikiensis TaxID=1942 RepID=UPI0036A6059A
MRATVIHAPNDIRVEEVPDAAIRRPEDAVVRVLRACICGSDLWAYRGEAAREPGQRIGHEFLGIVEETGSAVSGLRAGDLVVAPFMWSDGTCDYCSEGLYTSCVHGGFWGSVGHDGGQGEAVRVPHADGTLVKLPADAASDEHLLTGLLALSDVMGTGHHAALGAGVRKGSTVAVVGDGAVGLCGVLAAKRGGAPRLFPRGPPTRRCLIKKLSMPRMCQ